MSINSLVSIIIPCFNAAPWVGEAVRSCLAQTHTPVEIIVVDDGSTDDSLEVLRAFGKEIRVESGQNCGGNHARNRGFALSRGNYTQFLDADDYLLPEKIAHQVAFLEQTGADVVYGDWRHQNELADGGVSSFGPVQHSGTQEDVLEALLGGWWTANHSLLFQRQVVCDSGGWDESIQAGQDRDFFISVAMTGADIRYQPGCHSIYRRYGNVTVSTNNRSKWLLNHERLLDKVQRQLGESNRLTEARKQALAISYFSLARNYYKPSERAKQQQLYAQVLTLNPQFRPQESRLYTTTYQLLGFKKAEWLADFQRKRRMRSG